MHSPWRFRGGLDGSQPVRVIIRRLFSIACVVLKRSSTAPSEFEIRFFPL